MVYIYKKLIQGRPYYYLRMSKRVKNKTVVKDIAYLGYDIQQVEKKIAKLPVRYKKDIRKAYRNIKKYIRSEHYVNKIKKLKLKKNPYIDKELLDETEAIKLHFNKEFLKLDDRTIQEAYQNFLINFAFNTTSLEGNTITLNETDKLLKENLTPKNRTLREVFDLKNTEKVFFEILDLKEKINHDLIIYLHDKLLENIDKRKGYRTHDIHVIRSHFKASPGIYVKTDMGLLLRWFAKYENKLHPLILAGLFHQKFEKIHPFPDGNGRTGRILMNYILLKKRYPPLIIRMSRRGDYLDALSEGDKADSNEINPKYFKKLIKYISEDLIAGYWDNFLV
ncbi:MAG: Fic family protein [Nanoarchaeota archaeon]|nr:Fic family protein [Nanoarchaeota archaeon]